MMPEPELVDQMVRLREEKKRAWMGRGLWKTFEYSKKAQYIKRKKRPF